MNAYTTSNRTIPSALLFTAILFLALQAKAAVIVDTTAWTHLGADVLGYNSSDTYQRAASFSVSGNYSITTLTVDGFDPANIFPGTATIYAYLCSGAPATGFPTLGLSDANWTFLGSATSSGVTGKDVLTINCTPTTVLNGNTYSLAFAASGAWAIDRVDTTGHADAPPWYTRSTAGNIQPTGTWATDSTITLGFELQGTAVPEPSAGLLATALCLAGLAIWRKCPGRS